MSKLKTITFFSLMLFSFSKGFSQDTATAKKPEVDPSKPTNLYTQVNAGFEYQHSDNGSSYGPKINVQYAVNPDNLIFLELPFLYNDQTKKFGLSDIRLRYYNVLKRDISPKFIAIAPFLDITVPTGSYENGLGGSSWSLAGGAVFAFMLTKKFGFFPGISYVHVTKPTTDLVPDALKASADGIGLQLNTSYRFDRKNFLAVNLNPSFLSVKGNWNSNWLLETNFNKILKPNKLKMNLGFSPNLSNGNYTIKYGVTFYL